MNLECARVLNIGSTFGSIGFPGFSAYSASKFGLRGFSEALSRELADTGTTVQYAAPRATRTSLNTEAVYSLNDALGNRIDDPADVADRLVTFIESDKATLFVGWPERLYVLINAVNAGLVSRALRPQLSKIKHCALEI